MEFTTKSGVKVTLNPASLDKAFMLKSLVEKALLRQDIKIFDVLAKGDITYEDLFNLAMAVDSDIDVFDACFACMDKSIYNNIKITKEVFEDENARGDLYEVLFYCLKVNVYPFFRHLLSSFGINKKPEGVGEALKSI
jgi:hypothetical protein